MDVVNGGRRLTEEFPQSSKSSKANSGIAKIREFWKNAAHHCRQATARLLADLVVINKSDGEQEFLAKTAQAEYRKALHFLSSTKTSWTPQILRCSALEKRGMDTVWKSAKNYRKALLDSGE